MIALILGNLKGKARFWAIVAPVMMMLEVAMDLQLPTMMSRIIDVGVAKGDLGYVVRTGLLMVAITAAGFAGGAFCSLFAARAAMTMGGQLRRSLFGKVQSLSFSEIDRVTTGSLVTRLTNDVTQVQQMFLMSMRIMVRAPLTFLGSVALAFALVPRLAVVFIVALPAVTACVVVVLNLSAKAFARAQQSVDKVNGVMRENLLGARTVKAFTIEGERRARFSALNIDLRNRNIAAQNVTLVLMPCVTLVMNLCVVWVLWAGGNSVIHGSIATGKLMAFINYLVQIANSLIMLVNLAVNVSRAQASAARVSEILAMTTDVAESGAAEPVAGIGLEFRNVSFTYRGSHVPALSGISFKAAPGETIGVIGATGSGKTTLAALIPRLYDVTGGSILVGGTDVRSLSLGELRRRISLVTQETELFSGTIESNLRFGSEGASDADIDRACADAQAIDFLKTKELGYSGPVEQRGRNFSGGQRQRFSVARALARDADILVLDDSTSAVDLRTEGRMKSAIAARTKDKITIVIAQRISAVLDADRILVLDGGKAVACAPHRELVRGCEIYRGIVASQLGEEALDHGNR